MGNCIRKQSTQWGGEDWGSFNSDLEKLIVNSELTNGGGAVAGETQIGGFVSSSGSEVKIKISKKQLDQLLTKADFRGLSTAEFLAEMVNDGGDWWEEEDRQPWRPALHSIPE